MGRRHDYRPAVTDLQVPILVLHGAKDLQPEAVTRGFASVFPNAKVLVIEEAGHFPFFENPGRFAAAVGDFLGSMDAVSYE